MKPTLIFMSIAALSLSACSTIANGNNQAVNFTTGAVEGADCTVTGGRDGELDLSFTTPAEVQVRRGKAAIDVECAKEGFQPMTKTVESTMEATTAGNVVAGGFIGLGVDAMTGAMFKFPETIDLPLEAIGVETPTVTGEPVT